MSKLYTTIFLFISFILFIAFPNYSLGQKKKRTVSRPAITLAKIYKDIVGKSVEGITWEENNGNPATWTFADNETREIEILESKIGKENAAVTIKMLTKDAAPNKDGLWLNLKGNLRLQYERIAGGWLLTKVENLTFQYTIRDSSGSALTLEQLQQRTAPQIPTITNTSLVNSSFTLGAGKFQYHRFVVQNTAVVTGKFRAQGGGRNDIKVYIVSEDGFENFRNGNKAPTFYNSGQVTVGTINVTLGAGVYYLVFDNGYSLITPKAIAATVDVQYQQ